MRKATTALFVLATFAIPCAAQGRLGMNVYGFSYHADREAAHRGGFDNEFNPGLGLRWRTPGERFDWFLDGGVYSDSKANTAVYAGIATFWKPTQRLRLGAGLVGFKSETYNDGDAFIAPLPIAGYEWRRVTLNVVWFPRIEDVNNVNTFGFWLTLWP
jgi:hypothetical protein